MLTWCFPEIGDDGAGGKCALRQAAVKIDMSRSSSYPRFAPRPPWWGGDLQTLRNFLLRRAADLSAHASERLELELADGSGDRLLAMLDTPSSARPAPLVVLVHGLTGCEDSAYILASAAFHLGRGRRVLRLNLRGAGPSRSTCGGHYHGGCAPDIRDALSALDPALTSEGLFLVGYSLGGNVLLRFLAEYAARFPVVGAAVISAPIEPAAAARRIMSRRNAVYHARFLQRMKTESTADGARLSDAERRAIENARTVYEFDRDFIAPRNGYASADAYYADTAGARFVPDIALRTLMIHARNDPWIPADPYEALVDRRPPNVTVLLSDGGGHVGFHARGARETWHDRCVDQFLVSATA